MALNVLSSIARQAKCPPSARVAAAQTLLDRGWGKAPQEHTGPDGGDIKVTIRQIIESVGQSSAEPKTDESSSE
jgi:hypothetical protein